MPPQVLAVVVVLQALYGLPDYEAAQAVRCDLRWKAACGLGLLDPGFDPSLLTYFRRRLARSGDPGRLFAKVKEVIGGHRGAGREAPPGAGLHGPRRRGGDPGHGHPAGRRHPPGDPRGPRRGRGRRRVHRSRLRRDPGKPKIAWDDEQARAALVSALVNDALALLARLPAQPDGPAADAAGLLALVAGQDVEPAEGSDGADGRWRIARRTAPDRVVSTDRPGRPARPQEPDPPPGRVQGARGLRARDRAVHRRRADRRQRAPATTRRPSPSACWPARQDRVTVLGDTAYGTGELRAHLRDAGHAAGDQTPAAAAGRPRRLHRRRLHRRRPPPAPSTCPAGHTVRPGPPAR